MSAADIRYFYPKIRIASVECDKTRTFQWLSYLAFTQETRVRVPIAEFFFAFCARRVCARARARLGPLGLACVRPRVCGAFGVWFVCGGLGQGGGRVGCVAGW